MIHDYVVEHVKASSGLHASLVTVPGAPRFFAMLTVRGGFRADPPDGPGLSHLIEHLTFAGEARQFFGAISRAGGVVNANTTQEAVQFYVGGPATVLGDGVQMLRRALSPADWSTEMIETELRVLRDENVSAGYTRFEAWRDMYFSGVFGAQGSWMGTITSTVALGKLSRDRILQFARERFAPGQAWLVFASADPRRDAAELLGECTPLEEPAEIERPRAEPPPWPVFKMLQRIPKMPVFVARTSLVRPRRAHPGAVMNVICQLMTPGPHTEMFQSFRGGPTTAYHVNFSSVPFTDQAAIGYGAMVSPDAGPGVLKAFAQAMERARVQGWSAGEVAEAQQRVVESLSRSEDTIESLVTFMGWQAGIVIGRPPYPPRDGVAQVQGVTVDAVNAAAQELFKPDRVFTAVIGGVPRFFAKRRYARALEEGIAAGAAAGGAR